MTEGEDVARSLRNDFRTRVGVLVNQFILATGHHPDGSSGWGEYKTVDEVLASFLQFVHSKESHKC